VGFLPVVTINKKILIALTVQRGPAADTNTLLAFQEGFRMLAGDSSQRNYTGTFAAQGISFSCLGQNNAETNGLPNYNCPGGLRAQVFFPSCWVSCPPIRILQPCMS
jgi:hypothetical protein